MLVRVSNVAIMQAETPLDVAGNIDQIVPFIESADGMVAKGVRITGTLIQAMNGASRWGVTGDAIAVEATPGFVNSVGEMTVSLTDETGAVVSRTPGAAILGHPFNAVLFLVGRAKERGWTLRQGDLLSLGSFGRFTVAKPGSQAHLLYEGLPGGPQRVDVAFE